MNMRVMQAMLGAAVAASLAAGACTSSSDAGAPLNLDGGAVDLDAGTSQPPGDAGGVDAPAPDSSALDSGAPDGSAPQGACGKKFGTEFTYVVSLSAIIKVYLDGEIDELAASLTRDGSNNNFYPGGMTIAGNTIWLVGGHTPAGTPNPGWWKGSWPPANGVVDVTPVAITGATGATFGPLLGTPISQPIVYATNGGAAVYSVDLNAKQATLVGTATMPAYYKITEILSATAGGFAVLASDGPITGTDNLVYDVSGSVTTDGGYFAATAPLVGVRTIGAKNVWFDDRGFYVDGVRVRDVRTCLNGNQIAHDVFGVAQ